MKNSLTPHGTALRLGPILLRIARAHWLIRPAHHGAAARLPRHQHLTKTSESPGEAEIWQKHAEVR